MVKKLSSHCEWHVKKHVDAAYNSIIQLDFDKEKQLREAFSDLQERVYWILEERSRGIVGTGISNTSDDSLVANISDAAVVDILCNATEDGPVAFEVTAPGSILAPAVSKSKPSRRKK